MIVPVLAYHKIDLPGPDVRIRGAYTLPARFAKQILYLKKRGFDFLTASELIGSYLGQGRFPKNAICLTFDDGWKDNYTNAFPILKTFNVRATIFLVPSCIGIVTDKVTAEGEGKREHLSEANIREMSQSGIEFGSHSMNHKLLDRIRPDEIEREVVESKTYIENLLQKPCEVFAYPAGFFTHAAQDAVRRAGYKAAFSTVYGPTDGSDRFALNRTEILRRDAYPFQFARKIRALSS